MIQITSNVDELMIILMRLAESGIAPNELTEVIYLSIYIPWPFPPVWGVADNTKKNNKNNRGFTPFF